MLLNFSPLSRSLATAAAEIQADYRFSPLLLEAAWRADLRRGGEGAVSLKETVWRGSIPQLFDGVQGIRPGRALSTSAGQRKRLSERSTAIIYWPEVLRALSNHFSLTTCISTM